MIVWFNVVLIFVSILISDSAANPNEKYNIPQPKIEVFTPRGFRVSIENAPGLRLFAFHSSINKELIDLDAGTYSKESRRAVNGRWTIDDKQARLRIGDKIYYWVFVIKDNLGYRLDGQCFVVEELQQAPFLSSVTYSPFPSIPLSTKRPLYVDNIPNPPIYNPSTTETAIISSDASKDLLLCEETILNTTQVLINLRTEVEKLKKLNKQMALGLSEYPGSRQMKLTGRLSPEGSAVSVLQSFLREKLDLKPRLVWANRESDNVITFEVHSVVEKYEILSVAKEKLRNTKFDFS